MIGTNIYQAMIGTNLYHIQWEVDSNMHDN
jgi:hypothetical protein